MSDRPMTATEHAAHKASEAVVEYALTLHHQEGTDLPTAVGVAMEMTIGKLRTMQGQMLDRAQEITINGLAQPKSTTEIKRLRAALEHIAATSTETSREFEAAGAEIPARITSAVAAAAKQALADSAD